jgi:predicted nucleic acid-binding Zn ribbon protein
MRKSNEQSLGQVIEELLATYKLKSKLNEFRLIDSWEKIMGSAIAKRTEELFINKKVLHVRLNSSVLREELFVAREKIMQMLNEEAGEPVIEAVFFK